MNPPSKDGDHEFPVPGPFRPGLLAIVEAFRHGDYGLQVPIPGVAVPDASTARQIERYIRDYGETLSSLPASTWQSSVSRWMEGYWALVVDLYTDEGGRSDLILAAQVFEDPGGKYRIEVMGVYVP